MLHCNYGFQCKIFRQGTDYQAGVKKTLAWSSEKKSTPGGRRPTMLSRLRRLKTCRVVLSEAVDTDRCIALPEKSNMAVTESDPDPKVQKMSITFY